MKSSQLGGSTVDIRYLANEDKAILKIHVGIHTYEIVFEEIIWFSIVNDFGDVFPVIADCDLRLLEFSQWIQLLKTKGVNDLISRRENECFYFKATNGVLLEVLSVSATETKHVLSTKISAIESFDT